MYAVCIAALCGRTLTQRKKSSLKILRVLQQTVELSFTKVLSVLAQLQITGVPIWLSQIKISCPVCTLSARRRMCRLVQWVDAGSVLRQTRLNTDTDRFLI